MEHSLETRFSQTWWASERADWGYHGLTPNTLDLDYEGTVLFTGTLSNPTFKTGTFTLQSDGDPDDPADDATVTIYTPEPGTLALFGIGLLFLAGAVRRKLTA